MLTILMEEMLITPEGMEKLKIELEELTEVKRSEIIQRIQAAKELGDLSENADYQTARSEQSFIEGRIAELEEIIKKSVVVPKSQIKKGVVSMGSRVKVKCGNKISEYYIIGSTEADPLAYKISNESPLGKALYGKKIGDKVEIITPKGAKVIYEILHIE